MRDAFSDELTSLADSDSRIVLLMADIGNHMFDSFKERFPDRFFNCGIAEANMISIAAGLAMCGYRPFVYTFAAFTVGRAFEQIRDDLAFQNLPVVIIGLGGGMTYAPLGPTHYICEDIAITRSLPNMTVICPADALETRAAVRASLHCPGPIYIRIGKKREPIIHSHLYFEIGKPIHISEGDDICLLVSGTILNEVVEAQKKLHLHGIDPMVVSFHTVKPLNISFLEEVFAHFSLIFTIEDHSIIGGFGSAVAEWLTTIQYNGRLVRLGISDEYLTTAYSQKNAYNKYSLDCEGIAERVIQEYRLLKSIK